MIGRLPGARRMLLAAAGAWIIFVSPLPVRLESVLAQTPQAKVALKTVVIPVDGMVCVVCAASVKQAIKSLDGVSRVEVNLAKKSARVTFAPDRTSADRIAAAINNVGGSFRAGTPKEVE